MSRGLTLSDIYAGELVDANELVGTTRIVVTSAWGLLAPAKLTDIATWLGSNGLVLSSLIDEPNGVAGLDENGQIVGPIIISTYANAAAAGVLADGTLATVGDYLFLGDGSTTGGNIVARDRVDIHLLTASSTISLDVNADVAFIRMSSDTNSRSVTISNWSSIPVGYRIIYEVRCSGDATPPLTHSLLLGSAGVNGAFGVTVTEEGYANATYIRVASSGVADDLAQTSFYDSY